MQRNIFIGGFGLMAAMAVVVLRGYNQKKKANAIITQQKKEVETQKHVIEEKQKEILDSIHYAKRIQSALLTHERYIEKNLARLASENKN